MGYKIKTAQSKALWFMAWAVPVAGGIGLIVAIFLFIYVLNSLFTQVGEVGLQAIFNTIWYGTGNR